MRISDKDVVNAIKLLKDLGADATGELTGAVQAAAVDMSNHMREHHYFIGTGKGADAKGDENVLTFRNPDGSPRFKVRTQNLLNSIQIVDARIEFGKVQASIKVGMEYASYVEYGHPGARAFPFVTPAAEAIKPWFEDNVKKRLNALIRKLFGAG